MTVPKEVVTNTVKEFFGEKNKINKSIVDAVTHELGNELPYHTNKIQQFLSKKT